MKNQASKKQAGKLSHSSLLSVQVIQIPDAGGFGSQVTVLKSSPTEINKVADTPLPRQHPGYSLSPLTIKEADRPKQT
jgi:hypothetical protein